MQECLGHIIAALDRHLDEVDIQTKALVLLGVLIQVRGQGAAAQPLALQLCWAECNLSRIDIVQGRRLRLHVMCTGLLGHCPIPAYPSTDCAPHCAAG